MKQTFSAAGFGLLVGLALLLFCSGASGLIYQILWLRMLGLVFGVTVYAASTVWASFMAGLALGSIIGGRLGDRVRRPLVWFGTIEILVGLSALCTPLALELLTGAYASLQPSLPKSFALLMVARAAMSFAVLIVPTMLMGATMPIVIRAVLVRSSDLGSRVGWLYGSNTAGAIVGTLAAGLYLIPTLGIASTFQVAAASNVAVGAIAILIGWRAGSVRAVEPDVIAANSTSSGTSAALPLDGPGVSAIARRVVLAVFAVSGAASLALEVVWFRAIPLVSRPTVYTFALILAGVLFGIAVGSWLVTPLLRRRWNWLAILAVIEIAMAITALVSLRLLDGVPELAVRIEPWVARVMPAYLSFPLAAAAPAVLPTSLLLGMAFPIGLKLWADSGTGGERVASRVGTFYGLNLAGAICGSIVAGFLLLPAIGSRSSLIAVSLLILVSGLVLLLVAGGSWMRRIGAIAVAAVLFGAVAQSTPDPFDAFLAVRYPGQPIMWKEESIQATVTVQKFGERRNMMIDGNHQASDAGSTVKEHREIAQLPLAIHQMATDVLVVGLGGGVTPGAASVHEGTTIDIVELSSAVARGSDYFRHVNYDVLRRPNVRLRVDDGRNYLMLTEKRYDVVTADLIVPMLAGSNNLYSREYFGLVRGALKPGGLVAQWVCCTEAEHKTILRTFVSVFPNTTLWDGGNLAIGSIEPLQMRPSDFDRKLGMPGRKAAFDELGVVSFDDLLELYTAGPDEIRAYLGDGPILTDDRPLAEYFLSLPRLRNFDVSGFRGDPRRHVVR
jgi:spermidine synthase